MPKPSAKNTTAANVVAAYGRQFVVRAEDGVTTSCVTRGKRVDLCVGDLVQYMPSGDGTGVIETVEDRASLLKRSDYRRTKLVAANIDRIACVIATDPSYSEALLSRVLLAASEAGRPALIIVSKCDLLDKLAAIEPRLKLYESLGYDVARIAPISDPQGSMDILRPYIDKQTTVFLGQSGMGKSTLVNALVPDAGLVTQAISTALSSGKHTTTFTKAFILDHGGLTGTVIDSPGFQEFGLSHLHPSQVEHGMPEFAKLLGQCKFSDCKHLDEPGCAVQAALQEGQLDKRRYDLFCTVMRDLEFYASAAWKMPKI